MEILRKFVLLKLSEDVAVASGRGHVTARHAARRWPACLVFTEWRMWTRVRLLNACRSDFGRFAREDFASFEILI